ncbi:MAG: DUF3108 domain-containing protein [Deltaproteobacteria bacterium]|nr:DUF3108 domain-containing protein [Deltaproteobacteria bacterium]
MDFYLLDFTSFFSYNGFMFDLFSRTAFALFLLVALCFPPSFAAASSTITGAGPDAASIGDVFANEKLAYDIGFWFFHGVAESTLVLKEDGPGRYVATFSARTNGVLDTFLKHRRDRYVARLRLSEDGKRFLTESFEKEVEVDGKGIRRSIHKVDYAAGTVTSRSWGGGRPEKNSVEKIPAGMYTDDPLAAFYNFRFGVYGDIAEGKHYKITTFPKEGRIPEISIRIVSEKELRKRGKKGAANVLADARIDKELFGSKNGDIEIFFTKDMMPLQATAKGIILFGDVKGKLRESVPGGIRKNESKLPSVSSNP